MCREAGLGKQAQIGFCRLAFEDQKEHIQSFIGFLQLKVTLSHCFIIGFWKLRQMRVEAGGGQLAWRVKAMVPYF